MYCLSPKDYDVQDKAENLRDDKPKHATLRLLRFDEITSFYRPELVLAIRLRSLQADDEAQMYLAHLIRALMGRIRDSYRLLLMVKAVKGGIVSMGRIFRPSENERASSRESEHSLSVTHRASNGYGCAQFLVAWLSRRVLAG